MKEVRNNIRSNIQTLVLKAFTFVTPYLEKTPIKVWEEVSLHLSKLKSGSRGGSNTVANFKNIYFTCLPA